MELLGLVGVADGTDAAVIGMVDGVGAVATWRRRQIWSSTTTMAATATDSDNSGGPPWRPRATVTTALEGTAPPQTTVCLGRYGTEAAWRANGPCPGSPPARWVVLARHGGLAMLGQHGTVLAHSYNTMIFLGHTIPCFPPSFGPSD